MGLRQGVCVIVICLYNCCWCECVLMC